MEQSPVIGFVSYTRADNEAFDGIVDRLKKELEGKFYARTGRKLQLFIDRESIGWGEDWRKKINDSVKEAVVFIPVVSQAFFQSDACREELLAFTSSAEELGVSDLILPIVIASADRITAEHEQAEVRLIERLNFKDIENAYVAGYDSSDWRKKLQEMVKSLEERLDIAEARLQQIEVSDSLSPAVLDGADEVDYDIFSIGDDLDELTNLVNFAVGSLTAFGSSVTESGIDLNSGNANQKRANLARLAGVIREPAQHLEATGRDLERKIVVVDPQLRGILAAMGSIDLQDVAAQRTQLLSSLHSLTQMKDSLEQMQQVASILEMVGMVSVSMRKALVPALSGIRSIRNALEVADSWRLI